jgi:hypothetical protein
VDRDVFSDNLPIDAPTQVSILPLKKNQNDKNIIIMFTTKSESNSMVKKRWKNMIEIM